MSSSRELAALTRLLSSDENARARRFRFDRDRTRFVVRRAALRLILSRYTGTPAADLAFQAGPYGKPMIADVGLQFNSAHSRMLALLAVSGNAVVGVDIEWLGRDFDYEAFIAGNASGAERAAFAQLDHDQRLIPFFCWWTRKEALLKAVGCGLSSPLTGFDVSIVPDTAALLGSRLGELAGEWTMIHLHPGREYVGCLALPCSGYTVRAWNVTQLSSLMRADRGHRREGTKRPRI